MTTQGTESGDHNSSSPSTEDGSFTVGCGRPPKHSQFKPGQSGNPKGRPKGVHNMEAYRREIYFGEVKTRVGNKTRKVPRFALVEHVLANKALQGDCKAIQLFFKHARELGAFDANLNRNPLDLTKEQMAKLTDEELHFAIKITERE